MAKPRGYLATDRDRAEIRRAIKKLDKLHGPNVRNTRDDIFIGSPPQKPGGGGGSSGRLYEIVSSTRDGSKFRWHYKGTEVEISGDAGFGYEALNSDNLVDLINTIEMNNTDSTTAVQSGINLNDADITAIEAIPSNTVVVVSVFRNDKETGSSYGFFAYPNAPTIECAV
jgi:hypothetical protein